jgi:antitoxin ParD1/3/4
MAEGTVNVTLPKTLAAFVRERVAMEGYRSAADYVLALIRDDRQRQARDRLDQCLIVGLESEAEQVTPEYLEALRREVRTGIERQRKKA